MSFASLTFLGFLGIVFGLHWLGRGRGWQNAVLVVASAVFYGWWDWRFCGLMFGSALVDYLLGQALGRSAAPGRRRLLLGISLVFNLGLLGVFKYFGFFADSLALALAGVGWETSWTTLNVVLPVGISFYTFQTLSYTIDIYRGQFAPRRDLLAYLTFVGFFPQLVAGPIERASHLLPQFLAERRFDPGAAAEGLRFILWGLAKKLLLADPLSALMVGPFGAPGQASRAALAVAAVAFAFQIYGDFSGYSDIAVGSARLFGVRLMRNFDRPYFAVSITEFWRRWHISMSTWFRDYVYLPLGGNRGTPVRVAAAVMLTTLASGLWHGAAWHFVVWGGMHGLYLVIERQLGWRAIGGLNGWRRVVAILRTFTWVTAAWVMFRADSVADAGLIYTRVLAGALDPAFYRELLELAAAHPAAVLAVAALLALEAVARDRWMPLERLGGPRVVRWLVYSGLLWVMLIWGARRVADFIYFQF